jgi:hypothetical protein
MLMAGVVLTTIPCLIGLYIFCWIYALQGKLDLVYDKETGSV